ncbi:Bug family tripartite tricarboxylate transporter substrate binding protein [Roseomonas fluvialis]|uniref:Bug family tripartite tricarboxylate transporter substrate binding protein n=1 Tax=Roseomonas fluvialis TaxID=1750527 RepID=UPI003C6E7926
MGPPDRRLGTASRRLPGPGARRNHGAWRNLRRADAARSPVAPDVPKFAEQGFAGVEASSWFGIAAPSGTPAPVVTRLQRAIAAALAMPDIRARIEGIGFTAQASSPEALGQIIDEHSRLWGGVIQRLGIRLQL